MKQSDFATKKIAVLGFGVEGQSSAAYLAKHGAVVTVLDKHEGVKEVIKQLSNKDIKVRIGDGYLDGLDQFDMIVRSPGFLLKTKELQQVKEKGEEITSQTKLFFDLCPCPIIGVTGTKGKGTTASLIYEMLKKDGRDSYLGGNIGKPPFDFLDTLTDQSIVVLELSSFQLQDMTKSPHIAVMLMVTSEHLGIDTMGTQNYHEDLSEYVDAKRNILKFQTKDDFAIVNRDYPASNESDIHTEGKVYSVTRERDSVEEGVFLKDNAVWVRKGGGEQKIINTDEILLPGKHNLENVSAAVMASLCAGVKKENIVSILRAFKGLEHRLELVAEINGARYYDDSFSTTPETAIAAIEAFKEPEILILGGSHKGSDFSELGRVIRTANNIKAIIGIGVEWERMKAQFPISNFQFPIIEEATTMHQIVQTAAKIAQPGDVVLLSPACASFDMFKGYKERGEQFKEEVQKL